MDVEPVAERVLYASSKERVDAALLALETLAASSSSESVRRAACRDLLEFEGGIGPGAAIKARKPEGGKVDEKNINIFVRVLAEIVKVDGSLCVEGGGVVDLKGSREEQPLLPL